MKTYRIQPFVDDEGQYRWRAIAMNGQPVAGPQQGYSHLGEMIDIVDELFTDLEKFPRDWSEVADPHPLLDDGDDDDTNDG